MISKNEMGDEFYSMLNERRSLVFNRLEIHNAQKMGEAGLYFQLMEEAGELIQACSKKLRSMGYGQPLPKGTDISSIDYNVLEEIADTQLVSDEIICIRALNHTESTEHYQIECKEIADIQTTKVERTASRYKEAEHGRNSNS